MRENKRLIYCLAVILFAHFACREEQRVTSHLKQDEFIPYSSQHKESNSVDTSMNKIKQKIISLFEYATSDSLSERKVEGKN